MHIVKDRQRIWKRYRHSPTKSVLAKAFKIIDPSGSLEPGSREYDTIKEMIQGWIDQCGPEKAFDMARTGAKHLPGWRKFP